MHHVTNATSNCADDTRLSVGYRATQVWGRLQPVVSFYQTWKQNHLHLHFEEADDFKLCLAASYSSRCACCKFDNMVSDISTQKASMYVSSPPEERHGQLNITFLQNQLIVTIERTTNILSLMAITLRSITQFS